MNTAPSRRRFGAQTSSVRWSGLAMFAALLILAPWYASADTVRLLMLSAVLGLLALGLNLVYGFAGQLALGHVSFYAAAAYTCGALATRGTTSIFVLLAAGIGVAVVGALVTGIPGLRLSHWALAMVSFFLVALIPDLVQFDQSLTGGFAGLFGIPRPTLFGSVLSTNGLYEATVVLLCSWLVVQKLIISSAYGRMFAALRRDDVLVRSMGASPARLKLGAYVLSAVPAGIAGVMFAPLDGFVTPTSFTLQTVILVLAAVVIGGPRTFYGPLAGAAVLTWAQQKITFLNQYNLLAYGVFLTACAVMLPQGVAGLLRSRLRLRVSYLVRGGDAASGPPALGPPQPAGLRVDGVRKRFGGVQALRGVSLRAEPGEVTAVIGPNGSGKTTLLNVISGFLKPDAGLVMVGNEDLTVMSAATTAHGGVARTFQTPNLPAGLTTAETIATSAFSSRRCGLIRTLLRTPRWCKEEKELDRAARSLLTELGVEDADDVLVETLPLGTQRMVEIARAILVRPRVLLLDEAASGLSHEETRTLAALLRRIADAGCAVVLVEHNIELVMSLADHVVVLAEGREIAAGAPATVVENPEVIEVYLGPSLSEQQVIR